MLPRRWSFRFTSRWRIHGDGDAVIPAARVLEAGGSGLAGLGERRRVVSGAPAVRGGAGPRCRAPGALTGCACRQRHGAGAPATVAEEERCTVERRSDLSYAEFVQQYVRPPILAPPPTPKNQEFRHPKSMLSCPCLPCRLYAPRTPKAASLSPRVNACGREQREGESQTDP